ncbi:ferritin [Rubellicoccus peritrichatus]|uniref:Ferritin n=1 Tax=Rubellicoccus peritrichatus TaxID=3080537 RepID=A0AAQ3QU82_9BACT|nr:ferritin [Puniceicoccus sp. CR14]WOO42136.1 ferritin [Puniceicoccus sp. CR14]
MKISETIQSAINQQIAHELNASYLYLAMSGWFDTTVYSGFSKWMLMQSNEERDHAMRFFNYLNDRNGTVELQAIDKPVTSFGNPLAAFKLALESEEKNTRSIHQLYDMANSEKDYATKHFLSWFLQEQVEEEKAAQDWVDRLEIAGEHVNALMRLDAQAGQRTGD